MSALEYNGVKCECMELSGMEKRYYINGKCDGIIYVPKFTENLPDKLSFIHTESLSGVSFRAATVIRNDRSLLNDDEVIFINILPDGDPLKSFTPLICDSIKVSGDRFDGVLYPKIYNLGVTTAESICRYFGLEYKFLGK
jgi:hypothetical protein